jgi:DNA-binding LytR/AlgR family response regulator
MEVIICDDCREELNEIKKFCYSVISENDRVFGFDDSGQLKEYIAQDSKKVDLFILDIEMPEISGIELKNYISDNYRESLVVFLTSHEEMMQQAFGRNVVAFLNKDNYRERLKEEIQKISQKLEEERYIRVDANNKEISVDSIITITALNYYCKITYYKDNNINEQEDFLMRKSLSALERELDSKKFMRFSRSLIVGLKYIEEISGNEILLSNGERLVIPKGKIKKIRNIYHEYRLRDKRVI